MSVAFGFPIQRCEAPEPLGVTDQQISLSIGRFMTDMSSYMLPHQDPSYQKRQVHPSTRTL